MGDQFENRMPGAKKKLRWNAVPSIFPHREPPKQRKPPFLRRPVCSKVPKDHEEVLASTIDNMQARHDGTASTTVENTPSETHQNEPASTQISCSHEDGSSTDLSVSTTPDAAEVHHDHSISADQNPCQSVPSEAETIDLLTARIAVLERHVNLQRKRLQRAARESQRLKASFRSILSADQIRALERGTTKGSAWSRATFLKALRLRVACGSRGYKYEDCIFRSINVI
ncbi:uncharacterized protein LOC135383755 [Ornithodoros turicata]|uniref:uncharacterized protein LOC135383755 n=1 Tax=Ornithodoros turicata TaxID=34597 RepID=UPI003139BCC5